MKRLLYIISALICIACSEGIFSGENTGVALQPSSQINPSAYVNSTELPSASTKALINVSSVGSMEANVLRLDENKDGNDNGLYTYNSWEDAYLAEADVSSPTPQGLRSMVLNPVQAYSFKVDKSDTTFYHTRMVSWYPRTFNLYKNDEGKAPVMRLSDFKSVDASAYDVSDDGVVTLNFKNLDGSKDVMVSNIVEGQHWHTNPGNDPRYTYPFGQNDSKPTYTNVMTYKHYLSAVKVYAYAQGSAQVVSMWGAMRKVIVKNQPSQVSVTLPSPGDMKDATVADHVQRNSEDYGTATFSGKTEFPLIKTPMFGSESNGSDGQEVAEDNPHLVPGQAIYLGYALIQPWMQEDQKFEFDVHTDAGVLSLAVPMKDHFQPGNIYTVYVNFNTTGAIADIVLKSGDEHYYDLSAHAELSEEVSEYKYANSYIVSPDIKRPLGDDDYTYYDGYAFLATKVGSATAKIYPEFASDRTTPDIEPVRAGLLWETSPGLITQVEYLYGYIRFKVQPPFVKNGSDWKENDDYKEGNAVIAAYDSQRKVIWSWHIWVTDMPEDVSYTISSGGGDKIVTLLDRNLGATSANTTEGSLLETYGLYYQWGRKDPSMGPPSAVYPPQSTETSQYYDYYGMMWNYAGVVTKDRPGIRDGVENPMYLLLPTDFSMTTYQYDWMYNSVDNLWGDETEKTIYDPCPFDYMVPQDEISTIFATSDIDRDQDGMTINNSFFPYAGYKGVDKGVSSLSSAWRHVGDKGDYMSAKIDDNKHRSRTYISNSIPWTEYGADSDGDGDGDASRTYNSYVYADDYANRRTAASVRCVKMYHGLDASLRASFVGDRAYAFVGEGKINFTYSVVAQGTGVTIASAHIDLNENDSDPLTTLSSGVTSISGDVSYPVPTDVGDGIARYRLVSKGSNGVISRVSHALRLFAIDNLKIGDSKKTMSSYEEIECAQNTKYFVSFDLLGLESDFTVYVNNTKAVKPVVEGVMHYELEDGVNIVGHVNIQIRDAEGNLACSKEYHVKMSQGGQGNVSYNVDYNNPITNMKDLKGGQTYVICESTGRYSLTAKRVGETYKLNINTGQTITAESVFRFHVGNYAIGGVSADNAVAGAWYNLAAEGYLKEDFTFGPVDGVSYMISKYTYGNVYLYWSNTGKILYCVDDDPANISFAWTKGFDYYWNTYLWQIYPVTVTNN